MTSPFYSPLSRSYGISVICGVVLLLLSNAVIVSGQDGVTPKRGFDAGGSYALSDIETINTTNGNLMLKFPFKLPPARGGFSAELPLWYNSKLYNSHLEWYEDWNLPPYTQPTLIQRQMLWGSDQGGWHFGDFQYRLELIDRLSSYYQGNMPQFPDEHGIYRWKVKMDFPDGSVHEFLPRGFGSQQFQDAYYNVRPDGYKTVWACGGGYPCTATNDVPFMTGTLTYYTFDGSFIRLDVVHDSDDMWWNNEWVLYFPDGTRVTSGNATTPTRVYDRNNNFVEQTNATYNGNPATRIVDQLSREIVLESSLTDQTNVHVLGVGGADLKYQVNWKTLQVFKTYRTAEGGDSSGYPDVLGYLYVVSEIVMPPETGGLKYTFGYNAADAGSSPFPTPSYGWGELSSIVLPSGAQVQYQYREDGINGDDWWVVIDNAVKQKSLTYQQQYDGSSTPTTETWNYNTELHGVFASIVNPDGGTTVQSVDEYNRVYKLQHPDGTVVERVWEWNVPQGHPFIFSPDEFGYNQYSNVNPFVKTEFTSIRNSSGTLVKTAIRDFNYDKNGNVLSVAEYDWVDYGSVPRGANGKPTGIPANVSPKRITTNTYWRSTPNASDTTSVAPDTYCNSTSPNLRTAVASNEVGDGSQILARGEFFYDDPGSIGNLTQRKTWDSNKGSYSDPLSTTNSISVSTQYNQYGSPTLSTDARGYQTELVYGNVGGFSDLYPTQIKTAYLTPVQRTETREYDFNTGLVTRATDADNNISTRTIYDIFGRPTLIKAAEGKPEETRIATEYSDINRRVIVRSDLNTLGDGKLVSIQYYDQLGRMRLSRQLEDAATQDAYDETTGIKAQTRYVSVNPCQPTNDPICLANNQANLATYQLVSNPYRAAYSSSASGESTMGWTRSKSDNGGRLMEVQTFGGAGLPAPWGTNSTSTGTVSTDYDANFTTVTDQAGKQRRSMVDALGRLLRVDEPNDSGSLGTTSSPNQDTNYEYDVFGNLLTVTQGSQTPRTFTYDSLSRLRSAANPESGTISYTYDDNGNLTQKIDPRLLADNVTHVTTSYVYDALNRATSRSYNDGTAPNYTDRTPTVTYAYDTLTQNGKGRLASVSSSVSSYSYSGYDATGKVMGGTQTIGSQSYALSYVYDLSGHVTSIIYPSQRVVNYNYDNAGRLADKDSTHLAFTGNLGDATTTRTYSKGISYGPMGQMTQEQFGTTTAVYNKLFYNSRGQLSEVLASTSGNDTTFNRGKIVNDYGTTDNNGNLLKQTVYVPDSDSNTSPTSWYQQYSYDSLNRLTQVHEYTGNTSIDWQQAYTYDRYGNRTIDQNTLHTFGTGIPKPDFTVSTTYNRLGVPSGQSGTMTYDNAGNLTTDTYSAAAVMRVYDAENRMTQETQASSYVAGVYSYDGDGRRVKRNIGGVETWQVYGLGGELVAEYAANASASNAQKEYGYRNGQLLVTVTCAAGESLTFTTDPIVSGSTVISATDITELRTAVTQARTHAGLSAATWTDSSLSAVQVKAVHITELRTKLDEARSALGLSTVTWTDSSLSGVAVKAVHISELRTKVAETVATIDICWMVTDQLGTPRMIFDQTGSLANVSRHDYLPFGEELFAGTGGRTSGLGYTNSDEARHKFTQKERDNETGLDYFLARYYANAQGRFVSADTLVINPALDQPQLWNKYSYSLNNPLVFYDPDGKFPYSITIRSFAPPGSFQGTGFNDDRRGFSTDQDVSSKIRQSFTADPDTANVWGLDTRSSGTTWNGYGPKYSHPVGDISNIESSRDSGGHGSLSLQSSFSGSNPWFGFPMPEAPAIVVRSTISLQENKDAGTLSVSINISSKAFPATEAMIADKSGTKVFLAGAAAYGGAKDLYNRAGPIWKINMTILINGKGQFQGVMFSGKKYSIAEWNQLFTSKKAGPFSRDDLKKL